MTKNVFLKSLRVAAGRTQAQCARACNVSEASYCRVEQGKATLSPKCWAKLADYLHVPVEKLTDREAAANHSKIVNAILTCSKIK